MVMREAVPAPLPRAPLYGLIVAAPTLESGNMRLPNGWAFMPEGCGPSGRVVVDCAGTTQATGEATTCTDPVEGEPVWIWAEDRGSAMNGDRDWQGRARRQLTAVESYELADELWNGTTTQAATPDLPNRWLAGPAAQSDTVTGIPADPVDALGCMTAGLAEALKGQQGMVHATPQLLTHWQAENVVIKQGNLWVTAMGHIVVADAGYSGDGPDGVNPGATQWFYGTPVLSLRLGPVEVIPSSLGEARLLAEALDYRVNTIAVYAGRLAGVQWPNECAHLAAEVDLPACTDATYTRSSEIDGGTP